MSELILYTTEDGKAAIQLRAEEGTAWLTQQEMTELFATTKQNISLHIKNILDENELDEATVKDSLTVQTEGERQVKRSTKPMSVISSLMLDAGRPSASPPMRPIYRISRHYNRV